jgi:serine/threonine-protein kinase
MRLSAIASGPPDGHDPTVADRIGPYRLLRVIGEGTSGRVFEVEHERLGRRAAMKVLSPEHATHPMLIRGFFREALAVNRINHRHIVEITDIVERGKGARADALVMELLDGQSLAQLIATEGPLPRERFLPIMADVCDALAAAHAAGFVHRDLKPDNVFLVERGGRSDFVKLLDFGLAKQIAGDDYAPARTFAGANAAAVSAGMFVGTPAYVSPEQASGRQVDPRTDLYSVGVMLYEVATGRLPFGANNIGEFLMCHLNELPPHLPEQLRRDAVGRALDSIIQRCMEKDPRARFSSAAQVVELLEALAQGEAVQFTTMADYLAAQPFRSWRRRRPAIAVAIAAATLAFAGLVLPHREHRAQPQSATAAHAAPAARSNAATPASPAPRVGATVEEPGGPPAQRREARPPRPVDRNGTIDPFE